MEPVLLGLEGGEPLHLALGVIPMGWISVVGICQHHVRSVASSPYPRGAGLPAEYELRKDRMVPVDTQFRVFKWFQVFIDNFDTGAVVKVGEMESGLSEAG